MCGIAGFIDCKSGTGEGVLHQMIATLKHRGPDDNGLKVIQFANQKVALGHTRLSIIDLTDAGHQPMSLGSLHIVFNGEIYNYLEIKAELQQRGHVFSSGTDTEVILHAYREWGMDCLQRFNGMFAVALLDESKKQLYLIRDRTGVKPLYYYFNQKTLIFGSELKALHPHPDYSPSINHNAVRSYFDFGYIPGKVSIFKDTYKLAPGHYLKYDLEQNTISETEYWNPVEFYHDNSFDLSYEEAKEELHAILKSSFQYRMVADVPVGVYLSSGYDSSLVAAILQHENTQRLKTFTIGFEYGNNEAPDAKKIAAHLGTEHFEYICTEKEAQEIIPDLPFYYDEPFADSSAIPTMLVSKFAKEQVKVALSADGGDELFFGYSRYQKFQDYLHRVNKLPRGMHKATGAALQGLSFVAAGLSVNSRHRLRSVATVLNANEILQDALLYKQMHMLPNTYHEQLFAAPIAEGSGSYFDFVQELESGRKISLIDYKCYLPDDILTKVDRATMAFSLEGREPLLDHRIVEFAAKLPMSYKATSNGGKRIIKDIVHDYLPLELMDRPKAGFSIPFSRWFRGELNAFLMDTLQTDQLKNDGYFNVDFVQDLLDKFNKGKLYYTPLIWKILMFQMWRNKWL